MNFVLSSVTSPHDPHITNLNSILCQLQTLFNPRCLHESVLWSTSPAIGHAICSSFFTPKYNTSLEMMTSSLIIKLFPPIHEATLFSLGFFFRELLAHLLWSLNRKNRNNLFIQCYFLRASILDHGFRCYTKICKTTDLKHEWGKLFFFADIF